MKVIVREGHVQYEKVIDLFNENWFPELIKRERIVKKGKTSFFDDYCDKM